MKSNLESEVKFSQLCLTLCDPIDCTVHGILQARTLEWVAFPFSRGFSQPHGSNLGLLHCRQILYQLSHQSSPRILGWEAQEYWGGKPIPSPAAVPDSGIEARSPALQANSLPTELSGNLHKVLSTALQ